MCPLSKNFLKYNQQYSNDSTTYFHQLQITRIKTKLEKYFMSSHQHFICSDIYVDCIKLT